MGQITKKGTIVMTLDDVLAETSASLCEYFESNAATYGRFMDLAKLRTKDEIHKRTVKDIPVWLLRDSIKKGLTRDQLAFILAEIYANERKEYLSTDYMAGLAPTEFARKTLMNPIFSDSSAVRKAFIIVRHRKAIPEDLKTKLAFCKRWFGGKEGKYEFIPVAEDESPAEAIAAKCGRWDLVATDDANLVANLAKGDIDHREFLLPAMGYNQAGSDLMTLIKAKSATITYYEPK